MGVFGFDATGDMPELRDQNGGGSLTMDRIKDLIGDVGTHDNPLTESLIGEVTTTGLHIDKDTLDELYIKYQDETYQLYDEEGELRLKLSETPVEG